VSSSATPILEHVRRLANSPSDISDRQLLGAFLAGDREALGQLVGRHGPMIFGVCSRSLRSAQAEDAFQATILALIRNAPSLTQADSLAGWLHVVARNAVRRIIRDEIRKHAPLSAANGADPRRSPLNELTARELLEVLDDELTHLPDVFRQPLLLCYWEGLTQQQAAVRLGWSVGSVKGRLERGRRKLASRMKRRGFGAQAILLGSIGAGALPAVLRAAGSELAFGTAPPHIAKLAASLTFAGPILRRAGVTAIIGSLLVVALAAGVRSTPLPTKAAEEPAKPAPVVAARTDRFGDPLPNGAIMRLGTLGYRLQLPRAVAFRSNGELVALTDDLKLWIYPADGSPKPRFLKLTDDPRNEGTPELSRDACFAVAGRGGKVTVWQINGDNVIEFSTVELKGACKFFFSPDSNWLAVYAEHQNVGAIHLCNLATKSWRNSPAFTQPISSDMAFTSDSKNLIILGSKFLDPNISFIELATGNVKSVPFKAPNIGAAAFSPDGRTLAISAPWPIHGPEPSVEFFSTATGKQLEVLKAPKKGGSWISYSSDGKRLFLGNHRGMLEWDLVEGKLLHEFAGPANKPVAFSADGLRLASVGSDCVSVWDASTGRTIRPDIYDAGHLDFVFDLVASPNGKLIATGGMDEEIRIWEMETGRLLCRLPVSVWSSCDSLPLVFLPGSNDVIVISRDWVTPVVLDAASGKELRRFQVPPNMARSELTHELRLSADGKMLTTESHPIVVGRKGYRVRWDVDSGKIVDRTECEIDWNHSVLITGRVESPDGKWETRRNTIRRVENGESFNLVRSGYAVRPTIPRFSSDSRLLAVVGTRADEKWGQLPSNARVFVFDLVARANLIDVPAGDDRAQVTFSRDGRLLAVAGRGGVTVWDVATGKLVRSLTDSSLALTSAIAFSPDSRRLITGHWDTTALVWELASPPKSEPMTEEGLARAWANLAGSDATKAFAAECDLTDRAAQSVPFLRERQKPVQAADAVVVKKLIEDLDAKEYAKREAATRALQDLGEMAVPTLRAMQKTSLSAESRSRVGRLIFEATNSNQISGDRLRGVRAVAVLEKAGTEDAKKLLQSLASGLEEARLTREARLALERLQAPIAAKPN
jgi:RNA polymerase sigma factor (sigma-70 family)